MILGHRSRLDRRINELFIRAGCIHFLAVSGVHVVIVMFFVRMICLTLFAPPRITAWVMLLSIVLYVLVAEPRPPILRAGMLASLYFSAGDADRGFALYNKALRERSREMIFLKVNVTLRDYHDDPRFLALVEQFGLP